MIALEFTTFIGRFHPIFVHLPIGFILLAVLLEWWESFRKVETPSQLIPTAWFIGGLGAIAAALCGWYLGETGLYEEDQIFIHRWLGIALVPISFLGWWLKRKSRKFPKKLQHVFNILLVVLLSVEGHKGGNLTHGETYLTEYAPKPLKKLLVAKKDTLDKRQLNDPDSVLVYNDLIEPIFEAKCIACHNNEIKRGALNMSHPDSLRQGGGSGTVVIAGDARESEIFKRITLPQSSIKFMPPTNKELTFDEIKTIEWWINEGASYENPVSKLAVGKSIKPVLLRRYGLNTEPRSWYEKVYIAPLDSLQIMALQKEGFTVKTFGDKNPLLDVGFSGKDLTRKKMDALLTAKEHITWLSLSATNVEDEWLSTIPQLSNLTRLKLDKTKISDTGVAHLKGLNHLESLNLYASQVSDACFPVLKAMPELKRVYLSETKVSAENAKSMVGDDSELSVIIAMK